MKIGSIHLVYYSATFTTQRIGREIVSAIAGNYTEHDITMHALDEELNLLPSDLLILAMPVFGGLIPAVAAERLKMLRGTNTPAIIAVVFGNRHYDNALCQLRDIAIEQGFQVASAGAFIARHSIFSTIAADRPDSADIASAHDFACQSLDIITTYTQFPKIDIPGKPELVFRKPPLFPTGDESCSACGTCAEQCPSNAISIESPQSTDVELCSACGRCIVVCPNGARSFRGEYYDAGVARFEANFSARREPELFFPKF